MKNDEQPTYSDYDPENKGGLSLNGLLRRMACLNGGMLLNVRPGELKANCSISTRQLSRVISSCAWGRAARVFHCSIRILFVHFSSLDCLSPESVPLFCKAISYTLLFLVSEKEERKPQHGMENELLSQMYHPYFGILA